MSVSLLVLLPLAILALVLSLGFVGCVLDRAGAEAGSGPDPGTGPELPPPFTQYSSQTIDSVPVSYWTLGEPANAMPEGVPAIDTVGGRSGTYHLMPFVADVLSAASHMPPILNLGQSGIVAGDTVQPANDPKVLTTCIYVDGGFVQVPYASELNPSSASGFSVEAWVQPGWSPDPGVIRVVIASFDVDAGFHGFSLYASEVNNWRATIGAGMAQVVKDDGDPIQFDEPSHLVLTFEAGLLRLFVNGVESGQPKAADYQPSMSSDLFIGCGAPLPELRYPWVGNIQCVAVYNFALQAKDVALHFANGMGHPN